MVGRFDGEPEELCELMCSRRGRLEAKVSMAEAVQCQPAVVYSWQAGKRWGEMGSGGGMETGGQAVEKRQQA